MATTRIQVCNIALAHLGVSKQIGSITERSAEATAMALFYDDAVDEFFRDYDFPFSGKKRAFALVTEKGDDDHADDNYSYSYRYPADCLKVRRVDSEVRTDYRKSRWSYDLRNDDQGVLILTDKESAVFEFTSTEARNPARWHFDIAMAIAYRLAAYTAPILTKGDPFKIGQVSMSFFRMANNKARANASNEVQMDEEPDSEQILSRA